MTEENYKYRTSPFLLRNQFSGAGRWEIPIVPKAEFRDEEFDSLLLLGFDRTNLENDNHLDRIVHFFLYDYRFERVWKTPDGDIEKLKRYRAVLSEYGGTGWTVGAVRLDTLGGAVRHSA